MKELEKLFKEIEKIGIGIAEIRVTPESTQIRGNKPAILALISRLTQQLVYRCEGNFTLEEIVKAVEIGAEEKKDIGEEEETESEDVGEAVDTLNNALKSLEKLLKNKED